MGRINNESVRSETRMGKRLRDPVDSRVLRCFGHTERLDEEGLVERMMTAKVSG